MLVMRGLGAVELLRVGPWQWLTGGVAHAGVSGAPAGALSSSCTARIPAAASFVCLLCDARECLAATLLSARQQQQQQPPVQLSAYTCTGCSGSGCSITMSSTGTFRGTPKSSRPQPTQAFSDSPSNIPRPKLESSLSDAGSAYSASRAKQSKRDEV